MSHQVTWTHDRVEFFVEKGGLSERQAYIMRSRIRGATVTEQSIHEHTSVATIAREIQKLKLIYDEVQKEYPLILPMRRASKEEEYMDTH